MKYALIAASLLTFAVTPAFAGGKSGGSLLGGVLAPVTTTVAALNLSKIASGNNINVLSGNKTGVTAPIVIKGLLGGGSHGCGCN